MSSSQPSELYFSSVLSILELSPIVVDISIERKVTSGHEGYITLKVSLIHHYILDFFEYWNDGKITDYRYHVRDKDDKLLVRWDNAKHHKEVETYPHHQHLKDEILASNRPELSEMLNLISQYW